MSTSSAVRFRMGALRSMLQRYAGNQQHAVLRCPCAHGRRAAWLQCLDQDGPMNTEHCHRCAPQPVLLQAGGLGSTGTERVLDIMPDKVHQRVPLFIGSKKEVEYLESFTKKK